MAMIGVGTWATLLPPLASVAVTVLIGWRMVFTGGSHLVLGWFGVRGSALRLETLLGMLFLAAGAFVVSHPSGFGWLTIFLAAYLILESGLEFFLSFLLGSGWLLLDASTLLVLAATVWRTWSAGTMRTLGVLAASSLLLSGISRWRISLRTYRWMNRLYE